MAYIYAIAFDTFFFQIGCCNYFSSLFLFAIILKLFFIFLELNVTLSTPCFYNYSQNFTLFLRNVTSTDEDIDMQENFGDINHSFKRLSHDILLLWGKDGSDITSSWCWRNTDQKFTLSHWNTNKNASFCERKSGLIQ